MKKHEYKYALDVRNNTYCLQFVMRRLWLLLLFFRYQSNAVLEKSGAASGKNMYEEYEEEATTTKRSNDTIFSVLFPLFFEMLRRNILNGSL